MTAHNQPPVSLDAVAPILIALSDFYTCAQSIEWLHTEQRTLRGRKPVDLIREGRAIEVVAVIEQLASGAFV